ncbi:hypothetical protein ACQY0O_004779 [Thecaphora frezii]
MLSLPHRFLFGDQSKLDFKLDTVNGFARLYSERHIPYHDSRYWSAFLQFDSAGDIFTLLSLADLRKARTNAPENIVTLVRVLVAHLESLLVDPRFSPPPASLAAQGSASSYLGALGGWKIPGLPGADTPSADERDRAREALNVVRILTRALPAVLECGDSSFEDEVLWGAAPGAYQDEVAGVDVAKSAADKAAPSLSLGEASQNQFVINDEEDDEDDGEGEAGGEGGSKMASDSEKRAAPPQDPLRAAPAQAEAKAAEKAVAAYEEVPVALGERLIRLTIDLLFCSGFTIPWTEEQLADASPANPPNKVHYAIWEAGVGSSVDLAGTTRQHASNRVEVLRLLLVLLSKSIYVPADKQLALVDPALRFAVQDLERGVLLPLMCSLLNTSISNARSSASAWLSLPSVGGLVGGSGGDETQSSLVPLCLQVLDVVLNYEPPQPRGSDSISLCSLSPLQPGPAAKNVFRFYLSKLHRETDFDFIWTGMAKSLSEHIASPIQILAIQIPTGGGRRSAGTNWHLNQVAERLMLLWRLLELNAKFRAYLLNSAQRAPELLSFLLHFSLTYKDNLALQGLVRLCAFMLQDVSSEAEFAAQLAKPGSGSRVQLPSRLGLVGGSTAIDALVQGIYALVATTKGQLASLYPPLVIALSNTAPHWRALSVTSSTRLMHLLRSFSQPAFLLSDENHPRLLYYVLEAANSALTMQYSANPNLLYAFLLAHKLVAPLERMTLRRAVEEVWKKRRALGTDTRDWFENATRLEKVPISGPVAGMEGGPHRSDVSASVSVAAAAPSSTTEGQQQQGTEGDKEEEEKEKEKEKEKQGRTASGLEKGKMRRISSSSSSSVMATAVAGGQWEGDLAKYSDETIEGVARRYIGKNGFAPTTQWIESWRSGLPLKNLRIIIDRLLPEVERIASGGEVSTPTPTAGGGGGGAEGTPRAAASGANVDEKVLAFLREQDLGQHLDPALLRGVHSRPWQWTPHATIWLKSYLWGTIYVASLLPFGVWADTHIQLFRIHERSEPSASSSSSSAPSAMVGAGAGGRSGSSTPTAYPTPQTPTGRAQSLTAQTRRDLGFGTTEGERETERKREEGFEMK